MEQHLEKIAAHVPGVVYLFQSWPDGRSAFPYASPGMRDIYGVDPADVREDATRVFETLHPEDYDDVANSIELSRETLSTWRKEYRVCHPDGRVIWVYGEAAPERMQDGSTLWHGHIRDVTVSRAQTRRYELMLDLAADGVCLLDRQGNVIECSDSFARQLGYGKEAALKLNMSDWVTRDGKDEPPPEIDELIAHPHTFEARHRRRDGSTFEVELSCSVIDIDAEPYLYVSARDISERKASQRALEEASARHNAVISGTADGFMVIDGQLQLIEVNDVLCRRLGCERDDLLGRRVWEVDPLESREGAEERAAMLRREGGALFETEYACADGSRWPVEVSITYAALEHDLYFAFVRDMSRRRIDERLLTLRSELADDVFAQDQKRLLRRVIDLAEELTDSRIGFFHFVEDDQETISLQTWSTHTLNGMCQAKETSGHYPLSAAGVWVDAIRERRPVVHNDYASLAHRQGLPVGHAEVIRELTIPIIRGEKVRGILGVGNKPLDYDNDDINIVAQLAEIALDYVERSEIEQRIQYMAYNDMLTGLPNRRLLTDRLQQAISLARRSGHLLAVCYIDLDGFKPVNDRFGHPAGDQLLVDYTGRLNAELREGDTLARIGGDEFVALLNDIGSVAFGERILKRLLQVSAESFDVRGEQVHLTASIGVTVYPYDDADPDALLRHADEAMYLAKRRGKNTFAHYDDIEDQGEGTLSAALREFEAALSDDEMTLHYQPRIDLRTAHIAGLEALVRWQHPRRGLLQPDEFLPLIERNPLQRSLDEWVLRSACDQHMRWREAGLTLPISINVSPFSLSQESFPQFLSGLLADYPPDLANFLELEILETGSLGDTEHVANIMRACRELGLQFSLDDFGTGYSSLTYFYRLPIDVLKIDRLFVCNMVDEPRDRDVVEGVLRLAEALERPVVAEGVETIELGVMLAQLGCRYAQGYGIARPMPADTVADWTAAWADERIWRQLAKHLDGPTPHYDLNVAIVSHQLWMSAFQQQCAAGTVDPPSQWQDSCGLHHWLEGIGRSRYGERRGFPQVREAHAGFHRALAQLANADPGEQAEAWVTVNERSTQLQGALRALAE
jgi:diguanylate cyclase (GGDEF)-like protein/PAS domain S-box-containing protein